MLPPGSFISKPIPTCAALQTQVRSDGVFRRRLRCALNYPSDSAVIEMVSHLSAQTLTSPQVLRVYYARPAGAWGYKVRCVPAGTQFYGDSKGRPRLLRVCGNLLESLPPSHSSQPAEVAAPYSPKEGDNGMIVAGRDTPPPAASFSGKVVALPQTGMSLTPPDLEPWSSEDFFMRPVSFGSPMPLEGSTSSSLLPSPPKMPLQLSPLPVLPFQPWRQSAKQTLIQETDAPEPQSGVLAALPGLLIGGMALARRRRLPQSRKEREALSGRTV